MQQKIDRWVQTFAKEGSVVLLQSQSTEHSAAEFSYVAARPEAIIKSREKTITVEENGTTRVFEDDPWEALQKFRQQQGDWLFGYLGYDLKNSIEQLYSHNSDPLEAPDLFFMVPGVLLKIDEADGSVTVLKGEKPGAGLVANEPEDFAVENLQSTTSKEAYLSTIKTAKKHIYDGRYYEINLSHQQQGTFSGTPYALYRDMRAQGPVPFGAFISFDDYAICSLSPERFLTKKESTVFSQPIKGTMKRDPIVEKDQSLKKSLINSAKNKAENLMIVDLVRNDLSRIARPGSVEVSKLFEIQSFDTVHQMVSTVCAETDVHDPISIIKACYPMGSMTGAPKISAMQSIESLENYRRGIYSGAIGYITPQGNFDFNVVIRTAIIKNDLICYAVGGAITGDSDPEAEWQETWLKARALTNIIENFVEYPFD
jgi:para-aminobenzoate synthetase component 1